MVRKLAKQLAPLRALYATFCWRCPYTAETLERFVEVGAVPEGIPAIGCCCGNLKLPRQRTSHSHLPPLFACTAAVPS